jgi:hypothetical protein
VNLLQSLAMRTLEAAAAIAPPRVPYVNVFPEEPLATLTTPPEEVPRTSSSSPVPVPPRPAPRSTGRPLPSPPSARADAPTPHTLQSRPPVRRRDSDPRDSEPAPPVTEIVEHVVRVDSQGAPRDPPAAVPTSSESTPPVTPPTSREIVETHYHHWLERPHERVVHVVEHAAMPSSPQDREIEPAVVVRSAPAPAAPPSRHQETFVSPRIVVEPQTVAEASAAPTPAPQVHVAIGRVTVRMQSPPADAKSETTRPAAPDMDLNAYTAARRNRTR